MERGVAGASRAMVAVCSMETDVAQANAINPTNPD
jgi:hypothetical protein